MRYAVLLLLASAALADRNADAAAISAIRDYYRTLRPNESGIENVRGRLVPVMKDLSPKTGKSVRNVIRRGFDRKYEKDLAYHRCLCEILAAGGKPGINLLYKQYKSSMKNHPLREAMADVMGDCGDELALDPLLKMMHDKTPSVAAAAVMSAANYARIKEDKRKAAVKKMIEHFSKVTDQAAGKPAESKQMQMYRALKDPMNATLKGFTREALDSAAAWKSWFAENSTKSWE